jgi:hypothetical protein
MTTLHAMATITRSFTRHAGLLLMALVFSQAAHAGLSPLYDWIDVPVAQPTTTQRVRAAIIEAALMEEWTVVQNTDGSLTASMTSRGSWELKLRITCDATRYSIVYVDSTGLSYTRTYMESFALEKQKLATDRDRLRVDKRRAEAEKDDADLAATMAGLPEGAHAVRVEGHLHSAANGRVRNLKAAIRRALLAPPI